MREHKFMAFSLKWNKLIENNNDDYHIDPEEQTVWKDTACDQTALIYEYIGQPDSKGQDIYSCHVLTDEDNKEYFRIVWKNSHSAYRLELWDKYSKEWVSTYIHRSDNITIAGFIHDQKFKEMF